MEWESDWLPQLVLRTIIAASAAVLALVGAYLLVPMTPLVSFAVALGVGAPFAWSLRGLQWPSWRSIRLRPDAGLLVLGLGFAADAVLFALFAMARTDEAVISPWNAFTWEPFVLFGLATGLLFFGSRMRDDRLSLAFAVWHAFVAVSVSSLVYGIGFGFDPFLHRAAEEEIVRHGFIEPRQLLYAGQYALVSALHFVSGLPVKFIDVWLVPAFVGAFLPIGTSLGLRYGWGLGDRDARSWWIVSLAQPFMLLTFTVPFTWTYAWYLTLLFLLPVVARSRLAFVSVSMGTLAMALFHPLLAVPMLTLVLGYGVWARLRSRKTRWFVLLGTTIASTLSVPVLFAVYQRAQGVAVELGSLLGRSDRFTALFRSPFSHPYPYIPWFLEVIYDFRYWFPMVGMAVGILAMLACARRVPTVRPYLAFAVGLIGAIFGVSTLFSIRGIISHEQSEFALRLLTAWYLIPLPLFAVLCARAAAWRRAAGIACGVALVTLTTHAWFFSYPQFNLKYPYFSPGVSAGDVEAVHAIDDDAAGRPYVVLSNQMTSAAAIQEFHFASYVTVDGEQALWYAIPTGGPLYTYYSRAIYQGPTRAVFDDLHSRSSVDIIYFVIQDYWPWYPGFVDELERGSDDWLSVHDGAARIFIYRYGENKDRDVDEY